MLGQGFSDRGALPILISWGDDGMEYWIIDETPTQIKTIMGKAAASFKGSRNYYSIFEGGWMNNNIFAGWIILVKTYLWNNYLFI